MGGETEQAYDCYICVWDRMDKIKTIFLEIISDETTLKYKWNPTKHAHTSNKLNKKPFFANCPKVLSLYIVMPLSHKDDFW